MDNDPATPVHTDTVVFYHGNCADGFGAALCAWIVHGDRAAYVPCTDHAARPDADVTGKQAARFAAFEHSRRPLARLVQLRRPGRRAQ